MLKIEIVFLRVYENYAWKPSFSCAILPKNSAFHQSPFFIPLLHEILVFLVGSPRDMDPFSVHFHFYHISIKTYFMAACCLSFPHLFCKHYL